ncbi:Hypothetical predicted protein [Paramuricea clavata]|uniref:Uncharacterized protein n=1 Tax=Paramuricea clavata TaxID=317549 RepID=A0A6S7KT34_PARCT|nr:Hypothetical predicted protein [Paramuricea clavata]
MGRVGSLGPDEKVTRRTGDEICQTKLAIHNAYPEEMRLFWNISQHENKNVKPEIPPVTFNCELPHGIDVKSIRPPREPKLCKDNPVWDFGEYWKGSQKTKN